MASLGRDPATCGDIPLPIVKLNRWVLVGGVLSGVLLQQPLATTLLFGLLLPATLFGQRGSPIFWIGSRLLTRWNAAAPTEDRRMQRFNNAIATVLLGAAQVAFLLGAPVVGWACALAVALAASVALAGFCVGCFIFLHFKLYRFRLSRRAA